MSTSTTTPVPQQNRKKTMKKMIWIGAITALLVLAGFKLNDNKEEMKTMAALSEKVSERIPVELGTAAMETLKDTYTANGSLEAAVDIKGEVRGRGAHERYLQGGVAPAVEEDPGVQPWLG